MFLLLIFGEMQAILLTDTQHKTDVSLFCGVSGECCKQKRGSVVIGKVLVPLTTLSHPLTKKLSIHMKCASHDDVSKKYSGAEVTLCYTLLFIQWFSNVSVPNSKTWAQTTDPNYLSYKFADPQS